LNLARRGPARTLDRTARLLLGEPGWRLTDAEPMVVTSFRLTE
jgi:hypothetical protein